MMSFLSSAASCRWGAAGTLLVILFLCTGCASERARVQGTEQMLAAAGFLMEPADTPERQAQLASLPPHQLLAQPLQVGGNETVGYVYADPDLCHCLYVADQRALQAFQQLALQKQIADEHLQAAQMEENAAFDWSMWGPGRGCGYDDGGFGAPVRHFGNPTPWSENPFLNPCWPE